MFDKNKLFALMDQYYRDEEHVLAGGHKAQCYFRGRDFTGHDAGLNLAVEWLADEIAKLNPIPKYVAGPELGATTLIGGVLQEVVGIEHALVVRKVPKYPSMTNYINGGYEKGEHVVLVDDVVNSGRTFGHVIEKLTEAGLVVDAIYCLLYRDSERRRSQINPTFARYKDKFFPAFRLEEFRAKKGLPPLGK